MKFPFLPPFEFPPGRVVRRREITAIGTMIGWARNGLRISHRRVPGVLHGLSGGGGVLGASGDVRVLGTAGVSFCDLMFPSLYVGDRILAINVSAIRTSPTATITCQLYRFSSRGALDATTIEPIATLAHDASTAVRQVKTIRFNPVTVEKGYIYRVRCTAGNNNDSIYGGFLDVDHPREN